MSHDGKPAGPVHRRIPDGDDRERLVCTDCGFIHYQNPRLIVGTVCHWQGRVLLCRRAIEPRRGYWTLPAGFLELGETTEAGALRETLEESGAHAILEGLLALYNIPRIGQVHLIYRARLTGPDLDPGPESLDARLYDWADIPWDHLAFPNVKWSLDAWRDLGDGPISAPATNPHGIEPSI